MEKKIIIVDGKGRRVVTEIRRPDPAAVLVIDERVPFVASDREIQILLDLGYVKLDAIYIVDEDDALSPVKEVQTGKKYDVDVSKDRPGWAKTRAQLTAEAALKAKAEAEENAAKAKAEAEAAATAKARATLDAATAEAELKQKAEAAAIQKARDADTAKIAADAKAEAEKVDAEDKAKNLKIAADAKAAAAKG